MRYQFAIFDMDGTLVDSMKYWDTVCTEFLQALGIHDESVFDILKPMTVEQTADYLKENFGCPLSAAQMSEKMCGIMREHYRHDVQAKSGASAFLQTLRENGVRMCVASSSPVDLVELCLRSVGLYEYFEFIVSAETVGIGKTDPDIYWYASDKLGSMPEDTIVFEDALGAGLTAKRAGFAVAAVYDETSAAEWTEFCTIADYSVSDWRTAQID
ncbi:MAG: HAD family phosphatase [Clostridia bacterium]|nr:HAD family phosphatase [Clostridia bacterium]